VGRGCEIQLEGRGSLIGRPCKGEIQSKSGRGECVGSSRMTTPYKRKKGRVGSPKETTDSGRGTEKKKVKERLFKNSPEGLKQAEENWATI